MPLRKESSAYDYDLRLWVEFNSPADALIAELVLSDCIPADSIDSVLDAIRHPDFSLSQLTFKSGADIYARIAEYRRSLAQERLRDTGDVIQEQEGELDKPLCADIVSRRYGEIAGMPDVVFDLVSEHMVEDLNMTSLEKAVYTRMAVQDKDTLDFRSTLFRMSLVHRTWTLPIQRLLARRVIVATAINSSTAMEKLLKAPLFNQLVREFGYRCNLRPEEADGLYELKDENKEYVDHQRALLSYTLGRLPFIQRLVIMIVGYSTLLGDDGNFLPADLGRDLRQHTYLSSLSISMKISRDFFRELCHTLPFLHRLEYLSLTNYHNSGLRLEDDEVPSSSPPRSLKTIVLRFEGQLFGGIEHTLLWLLCPSGDYPLQNLSLKRIADHDYKTFLPLLSDIHMCCSQLERLYVKLIFSEHPLCFDEKDPHRYRARRLLMRHLSKIFSSSSSLKVLHFDNSPFSKRVCLPNSLEELGFFICAVLRFPKEYCDTNLHHVLTAQPLPSLQCVVFFGDEGDSTANLSRYSESFEATFPRTFQLCKARGVRIICSCLKGRPVDDRES